MAKSYYSFEKLTNFGEISGPSGSVFSSDDKMVISAGVNNVNYWSLRKLESVKKVVFLTPITSIALRESLALGFRDGKISVYNTKNVLNNSFEGHESSVSALAFAEDSLTLYSGSFDTTIIVWDLVADCAVKRLQGHRDAITALFISDSLWSASKDKMIKEWDADMCVNTFICPSEVWGLSKYSNRIYAASNKFIRVYEDSKELGVFERGDVNRCKKLIVEKELIGACSAEKLEIWRIRSGKELEKKLKRRRKRNRDQDTVLQLQDEYEKILSNKFVEKMHSFSISNKVYKSATHEHKIQICVSYSSNSLEIFTLEYNLLKNLKTAVVFQLISAITQQGHRSPARTLSLSESNSNLLSGSGESVKVWDVESQKCIVSIESAYCICSCWFPGDRYAMIGSRTGDLQVFDVLSSQMVSNYKGHEGSVWSCDMFNQVLVTGSADCTLKFWQFYLTSLELLNIETLTLKDEILYVKYSPNGKYVCAALLDSTIQVLYADSKKLLFSLYAHKLPVTSFDISYDNLLLVSGSSDKTIKIWGMDFGDCHKSIIAHSQPITDVKFVPETHFCFTSSRDFTIKYWDIDTKEVIQVLKGHNSEVWNLCISLKGDFLISTANDYNFSLWTQTDTQLFLQEQKDIEIEENAKIEDFGLNKSNKEAVLLTHASAETLKSGEALIEGLEICIQYREHQESEGKTLPPPHFAGKDEYGYILKILCGIPAQYMDSVMYLLPYSYALELFRFLEYYLDKGVETELIAKIVVLLIKVHENSLVSSIFGNDHWYLALDRVKEKLLKRTQEYRNLIGRNIAATKFILRSIS